MFVEKNSLWFQPRGAVAAAAEWLLLCIVGLGGGRGGSWPLPRAPGIGALPHSGGVGGGTDTGAHALSPGGGSMFPVQVPGSGVGVWFGFFAIKTRWCCAPGLTGVADPTPTWPCPGHPSSLPAASSAPPVGRGAGCDFGGREARGSFHPATGREPMGPWARLAGGRFPGSNGGKRKLLDHVAVGSARVRAGGAELFHQGRETKARAPRTCPRSWLRSLPLVTG